MNSQREIRFDTLSFFIDALRTAGITQVIAAVIDEKRSVEKEQGVLTVEHINMAEFIAYKNSTIFKLSVIGDTLSHAEEILRLNGISSARRDRNIIR